MPNDRVASKTPGVFLAPFNLNDQRHKYWRSQVKPVAAGSQ